MKIFHDPNNKQVNILDERFYTKDNINFYPSVTTVLQAYPKGYGFEEWLKKNADDADDILREAGEQGSKVHDAVDRIIKGHEVTWTHRYVDTYQLTTLESHERYIQDLKDGHGDKYIKEVQHYTLLEWQMILRFVEFVKQCEPVFIANEFKIISDEMQLGGTIDIVCDIRGERWLIDVKTSNHLHKTHELQLAAYAKMFNEKNPEMPIDKTGILWLKAQTRGERKDCIQGAGWQLKEYERSYEESYRLFRHTRAIWNEENPNYRPKNMIYPDRIKIPVAKPIGAL